MTKNTNHDDARTPDELRAIEERLDTLAHHERDGAPAGLVSRLATTGAHTRPPSVIARIGGSMSGLRLAATLAIVALGAIAGVWLTTPSAPAPTASTDQLASEITETLERVYTQGARVEATGDNPLFSLGGAPGETDEGTPTDLWDLGAHALSWPDDEEVL